MSVRVRVARNSESCRAQRARSLAHTEYYNPWQADGEMFVNRYTSDFAEHARRAAVKCGDDPIPKTVIETPLSEELRKPYSTVPSSVDPRCMEKDVAA
jgi:hypothetical protein